MEKTKSERIFEYDLMRVLFSLMVLGIHILAKVRGFSKEYNTTWHIVNIVTNFLMICNPLFFILSGKFNLNKKFDCNEDYKEYYKSKVVNIIVPFVIISIIVYIIFNYNNMSLIEFFKKFVSGDIEGTYWFIYSLIGMLIYSPFFSKMVNNMNKTDKKIFFWISILISGIIVTLSIFNIKSAIGLTTFGILYWNFYYVLGSFIEEIFETKRSRKIMIMLGLTSFIIQFLLERFYNSGYRLYDPSPILTFEAIGLYFIILEFVKIKSSAIRKGITFLASYTYIFYLCHNSIIKLLFKYLELNLNTDTKMNLIYGIITYVIAYIITMFCSIVFKYMQGVLKRFLLGKEKDYAISKEKEKNMMYDYLIVGSGLFGSIFAYEANKRGKKCLVIDKRSHVGGNIYTENVCGINVHKYGAHIFHTSNKAVWDYINQFSEFNRYTNSPIARYKDELYNLPFNMNTFSKLWNIATPAEAMQKIEEEKKDFKEKLGGREPANLEEQAISLIGKTIYEKLIKGYTEKQWGKRATELPSFIIKRLPVRFIYDNNYFNDTYQGIPVNGYTKIIENMLNGIDLKLNYDFFEHREELENIANKIIFTGPIDKYYNYQFGELEYRSLRFETEVLDMDNYQGNAVVNYTEYEVPYTRIIEHKHFEYGKSLGGTPVEEGPNKTIITREYPDSWNQGKEPYYPVNNDKNNELYQKYEELSKQDNKVIFGGRLGAYKYYDMDKVIIEALNCVKKELS